jgi:hypothetical protein
MVRRTWPLGGMADAGDLKSLARKGIPVRIREGLPKDGPIQSDEVQRPAENAGLLLV